MNSSVKLQAVFFDLDGTLIDSAPDLVTATNKTLAHYGMPPRTAAEIRGFIGQGLRELIKQSIDDKHQVMLGEIEKNFIHYYNKHLADQSKLYDGTLDLLESLHKKVKVYLLTNKNESSTMILMKHFKLEKYFTKIFGGDTFAPRKKPDPVAIESVYAECRVKPLGLAMVGDSWVDVKTGRNANALTLMHKNGYAKEGELERAAPDFIYHNMIELSQKISEHL
jgi:phosphoglycolate phosphatase